MVAIAHLGNGQNHMRYIYIYLKGSRARREVLRNNKGAYHGLLLLMFLLSSVGPYDRRRQQSLHQGPKKCDRQNSNLKGSCQGDFTEPKLADIGMSISYESMLTRLAGPSLPCCGRDRCTFPTCRLQAKPIFCQEAQGWFG